MITYIFRQKLSKVSAAIIVLLVAANLAWAQSAKSKANAALGRAFYEEAFNGKSADERKAAVLRVVSPEYIQHNPIAPPGRDGLIGFEEYLHQVIPDIKVTIFDVFATDDRVVVRASFTGTVSGGPFLGIPAAGQKLEFDVIDVWTVRNGQLYEHWDQLDWPRAFVQLGIQNLPQPFIDAAGKPVNR